MHRISKCNGEDCPIKTRCYRHSTLLKESKIIHVVEKFEYDKEKGKCDDFIANTFIDSL
jgi:hypothetical protein